MWGSRRGVWGMGGHFGSEAVEKYFGQARPIFGLDPPDPPPNPIYGRPCTHAHITYVYTRHP